HAAAVMESAATPMAKMKATSMASMCWIPQCDRDFGRSVCPGIDLDQTLRRAGHAVSSSSRATPAGPYKKARGCDLFREDNQLNRLPAGMTVTDERNCASSFEHSVP